MMDNNNFDLIDDYLAGKLKAEKRAQFEANLQSDPVLAEEVRLYQDMTTSLSPNGEDALRENLKWLGEKHLPPEAPKKNSRLGWLTALVLLSAVAALGIWKRSRPNRANQLPAAEKSVAPIAQQPSPVKQEPVAPEQHSDSSTAEKSSAFAANFRSNPRLEDLAGSQLRGADLRFRMRHPAGKAKIKRENGQVSLLFSGVLEQNEIPANTSFRLLMFSNKVADYENARSIFQKVLDFEKLGESYHFQINKKMALVPGLYYYLIEEENSGTLYHVGKIMVTD